MDGLIQFLTIAILCSSLIFTVTPQGWKMVVAVSEWGTHKEVNIRLDKHEVRIKRVEEVLGLVPEDE